MVLQVCHFFKEFIQPGPAYIRNRPVRKENARHGFIHCFAVVKVNNVAAVYIAKALHGKKFFNFRNAKGAEEGFFCI
jgi:hypothetical protein